MIWKLALTLLISVYGLYRFIKWQNQVGKMSFGEKLRIEKMHKTSIPEVISFERWKYSNFNELYFLYSLTEKEFTFPEFTRNLFDGNIILELNNDRKKRINQQGNAF